MKNSKKLFFITLFSVMTWTIAGTFTSCSDETDSPETSEMNGKEKADFIKGQVLDEEGNIVFYLSKNSADVYLMPVKSSEDAYEFSETFSCTEHWNGNTQVVDLGDGCGTVRLMPGDKEGVFSILVFNVKDIPPFTLELTTLEYCKNENMTPSQVIGWPVTYKCKKCGRHYTYAPPTKCFQCGGTWFVRE